MGLKFRKLNKNLYAPRYMNCERENLIAQTRVEENLTQKELAYNVGVKSATLSELELGYKSPFQYGKNGRGLFKPWVLRLCKVLNATPSYLFPREVCDLARGKLLPEQILECTNGTYNNFIHKSTNPLLHHYVNRALITLSPREESCLRKRFGIDSIPYTLREIAKAWKVKPERIRQIELKALRKLRHPLRSKELKPFFMEI